MKTMRYALLVAGLVLLAYFLLMVLFPVLSALFMIMPFFSIGIAVLAYFYADRCLCRSGIGWALICFFVPFLGPIILAFLPEASPNLEYTVPQYSSYQAGTAVDAAPANQSVQRFSSDQKGKGSCQRCGGTILTKQQFIQELAALGIEVDPLNVDRYKVSGTYIGTGGDVYHAAVSGIQYDDIQKKRGFKCHSCGNTYCMGCLVNYAPAHANGGKACLSCRGAFMEL
jgi:DNA-directed RNA polymerase subunit RPC12/RpoP